MHREFAEQLPDSTCSPTGRSQQFLDPPGESRQWDSVGMSGEKGARLQARREWLGGAADEARVRWEAPDSAKSLTTPVFYGGVGICVLPSLSEPRRGGSSDERRFSLAPAFLVVCRQPSRNPLGQHRGRHECFGFAQRACCGVFRFALTAMTKQLGSGDPRRPVPGCGGMSRRMIGWMLTDSSRFLEKNSARRVFSRALHRCKVAAQLVPPRDPIWHSPGQITMLARRGRLNGRMTWSARIHKIGVCLARLCTEQHTDSRAFLSEGRCNKIRWAYASLVMLLDTITHNRGGALTVDEVAFRTRHTCRKIGQKRSLPALQS